MFSFSFLTFSLPPSFLLFSYSPFVFFSSFLFFFSSFLFSSTYFLPFIPSVSLYHFLPFPVFTYETTFLVPFFYPVFLNSPLLSFIAFLPSSFSSSSTFLLLSCTVSVLSLSSSGSYVSITPYLFSSSFCNNPLTLFLFFEFVSCLFY